MPSELLQLQWRFADMTRLLFTEIARRGYRWTYGDAYRDPRLHGAPGVKLGYGHKNSGHKLRLAIDINLFLADGTFLEDGSGHDVLHEFWSSIGGADPVPNDANHYSFEYKGMR